MTLPDVVDQFLHASRVEDRYHGVDEGELGRMGLEVVVTRRLWGAYWGYEWLAIVVYPASAFFMTTFLIIFFVERRRAGLFEFSIRRRPRKES